MKSTSKIEAWDAKARELGLQVDPEFPLYVVEEEKDVMTFRWDPQHPLTSVFNDWTEEDFADCLLRAAQKVIDESSK